MNDNTKAFFGIIYHISAYSLKYFISLLVSFKLYNSPQLIDITLLILISILMYLLS